LGGFLAEYLKDSGLNLNLMVHHKDISPALKDLPNVRVFKADLNDSKTLKPALQNVDTVVHFAGVLFKHNPARFLHMANTKYFENLMQQAIMCHVKRVILISFPHVEGETYPERPAKGKHYGNSISVHARTRREEEKALFGYGKFVGMEAIALRTGMVYGKNLRMLEAAKWFARHRLLWIWKKPTHIHLISLPDFLEATKQTIIKPNIQGIYHIGDEGKQTIQHFLDKATEKWGLKPPRRMPVFIINLAAIFFELCAMLFGVKCPLTIDVVKLGMGSYYGDTNRMKEELLPELKYETFLQGIDTL